MTNDPWYLIQNVDEIPSPSLLVYTDRVAENVQRMIRMTGGPDRLRPHIKTHKLPELIRLQWAAGITKFTCATIAEAEMVLACAAPDLLLAYQPVGPNIICRGRLSLMADTVGNSVRWISIPSRICVGYRTC